MTEFVKGFKEGAKRFGAYISTVVNSVLLFMTYIGGVGTSAITSKMFRKHFLDRETSQKRESYWSDLDLKKKPMEEYQRQF